MGLHDYAVPRLPERDTVKPRLRVLMVYCTPQCCGLSLTGFILAKAMYMPAYIAGQALYSTVSFGTIILSFSSTMTTTLKNSRFHT